MLLSGLHVEHRMRHLRLDLPDWEFGHLEIEHENRKHDRKDAVGLQDEPFGAVDRDLQPSTSDATYRST